MLLDCPLDQERLGRYTGIFIQFLLHRPTLQCQLKLHQRQVTIKSNNLD